MIHFTIIKIATVLCASTTMSSTTLCPLTGEALPENDEEIAVVYTMAAPFDAGTRQCGHEITLQPLMDWLSQQKGIPKCPSCNKGLVITICDKVASESMASSDEPSSSYVALRFGTHNYFFGVTTDQLAQDRITNVLQVEDLKILHSGKSVYPDKTKTAEEVSNRLLEISADEMANRKRPTLIIMGAKTGRWGAQGGHLHK
jgi:hypothetical protein